MAGVPSSSTTPERRPTILQLALPSILSNLLYGIVGLVQTKVVGELGAEALAATGAGQRVFFALQAVMMAIGAGTTALVARSWGREDREEAARVTMASLAMAGTLAVLVSIPGVVFARSVASIFGLDEQTLSLAADYIRWLSVFNLAFAANFILPSALRASGDAWTPLYVGIGMNVLNVPLLYCLVFGLYGFPAMGVAGAAVAAGITFTIGAIVLIAMWWKQKLRIRFVARDWMGRARLKRLMSIGYPAGMEQLVFQAGFFVFLMIIGRFYGTEAFAAYGIGVTLLNICMVVGFGFSIAGSTLVGQHLGANDPQGAVKSGWRSMLFAVVSMGVVGGIVIFFARELATFFIGSDALTVQHTVEFTWILGIMTPLMAVEFAIGGALRGAGDTRFPLICTFLGLIGVRCTLAAVFTFAGLSVVWIYGALIGDYVLKAALLVLRFRKGRWMTLMSNEELAEGRA